jgi:hypothetical protein
MSDRSRALALAAAWLRGRGHLTLADEMLDELRSHGSAGHPIDLTGKRIGRLLVVSLVGSAPRRWRVKCDCGVEKIVSAGTLINGNSNSCGCLRAELIRVRNKKHGMTKTRTYRIYISMLRRAHYRTCVEHQRLMYAHVSIHPSWLKFENFLKDMGECPPGREYSLDRWPNNAGNYEPGNCRWATRVQQARNVRNNRILEIRGERLTVAEWSERTNIQVATIYARVYSGWSHEDAVFGALQKGGGRVSTHT